MTSPHTRCRHHLVFQFWGFFQFHPPFCFSQNNVFQQQPQTQNVTALFWNNIKNNENSKNKIKILLTHYIKHTGFVKFITTNVKYIHVLLLKFV